jgi:hypothetical protein
VNQIKKIRDSIELINQNVSQIETLLNSSALLGSIVSGSGVSDDFRIERGFYKGEEFLNILDIGIQSIRKNVPEFLGYESDMKKKFDILTIEQVTARLDFSEYRKVAIDTMAEALDKNIAMVKYNASLKTIALHFGSVCGLNDQVNVCISGKNARYPKYEWQNSPFVSAIRGFRVTENELEWYVKELDQKIRREQESIRKYIESRRKEENRFELENKKKMVLIELGKLCEKYKFSVDGDISFDEVMRLLTSSDKYLDLIYAMEKTRSSWVDGFYLVEDALGRFSIDTDADKKIYSELRSILDGDERDGRIFRDCEYNYSALRDFVSNKDLLDDYRKLREFEYLL